MNLEQRLSMFGGKLKLKVGGDDVLVVTHQKIMNTSHSKYLLDHIDPRYESFKQFSLAAAITSIVCLILSVYLWWYAKVYYTPPKDGVFLFLSVILFGAFLIAGVKALRSRVNVICFNSHDGRRLFSMSGNKPSAQEVEIFCKKLGKNIERIRYNDEISSERMADILTRHVNFLYEQKILSETETKSALNRISDKPKLNVVRFPTNENP